MLELIWITAKGHRIPVSQLSNSHLQNIINKILREQNWRREYLDRLLLETEIRSMKK